MGEFSHLSDSIYLLLLILVANGSPLLVGRMLNDKFNCPVDFGARLSDGYPVFGHSKTWRGVASAVLLTTIISVSLGYPHYIGLLVGIFAMLGDLFSSFVKRRLAIEPSGMLTGMDQIPESLFPALALQPILGLHWYDAVLVMVFFVFLNRWLSIALFKLNIRSEPY